MRRSDKGQAGFTYAQWDSLDVSDDEAEKKVKEFNKPENSMLTNYARGLLAKPGVMGVFSKAINEIPQYDKAQTEPLLTFICVQQHDDATADNRPIAANVIGLFEEHKVPRVELLLAITEHVRSKIDTDASSSRLLGPVYDMLIGALNTVSAAKQLGGARKLFDVLVKEPDSDFTRQYLERSFGYARFERHLEKKRMAREAELSTWLGRLDAWLEGYGTNEWFLSKMPKPARKACEAIYDVGCVVYDFIEVRPKKLLVGALVGSITWMIVEREMKGPNPLYDEL